MYFDLLFPTFQLLYRKHSHGRDVPKHQKQNFKMKIPIQFKKKKMFYLKIYMFATLSPCRARVNC